MYSIKLGLTVKENKIKHLYMIVMSHNLRTILNVYKYNFERVTIVK